jgi:hypothetical protein
MPSTLGLGITRPAPGIKTLTANEKSGSVETNKGGRRYRMGT